MIHGQRVLALIPARGGSKSIHRKNIANCAGKPLIQWTIDAARSSKYIDTICVSSDDKEILRIADSLEAFPIVRPEELATDESPMAEVVVHALDGRDFDICILLQPTSPLRIAQDIDGALEALITTGAETVVSVHESYAVPFNGVDPLRRQERSPALFLNGAIYAMNAKWFVEHKTFVDLKTVPYLMPSARAIDIDFPAELSLAALLIGMK